MEPFITSSVIEDAHVKEVLKVDKGPDAQLLSWSTDDFTEKGDNYATVVTRINVAFNLHGNKQNSSYIVKINPKRGILNLVPDFILTLFKKEVGFYVELAVPLSTQLTELGMSALRLPKYFHADMEGSHELLFLEDLTPRGFQMFDRKKGMDTAHTSLVLQELGRFHAASILLQATTPQDLADKHSFLQSDWTNFSSEARTFFNEMCGANLGMSENMLHNIGGYTVAERWAAHAKENASEVLDKLSERKSPFEVVCHGDCWNNNVLFRYNSAGEPVEVMLVDLQVNRVASPATDLSYLLYTSLTGDVRRDHLDHFLTTYHASFTAVLEAAGRKVPFTLQQLHQEFRDKREFGILFGNMLVGVMMAEKSEIPDFGNMKDEDQPRLLEEYKLKSIKNMEKNPMFRSRYLSLFESMKD